MSRKQRKFLKNIEANVLPYTVILLLITVVFSSLFLLLPPQDKIVSAGDFDDWDYYRTITVSNKLDDYQTKIVVGNSTGGNVNCSGYANSNFSDLRFVYDNSTELPYWIENYTVDTQCTVWVNNSGNYSSFEMFYGNTDATVSTSNGSNTFIRWDDFDEGYSVDDTPKTSRNWSTDEIDASNYLKIAANPDGDGNVMKRTLANDDVNAFLIQDNFTENPIECRIFYKVYIVDGNDDIYVRTSEGGLGGTYLTTLEGDIDAEGRWEHFDGEGFVAFSPSSPITSGYWYNIEDRIYKQDYKFVNRSSGTVHDGALRDTMIDGIDTWESWGRSDAVVINYYDNFFICNYTSGTEPSFSFGEEEEPSGYFSISGLDGSTQFTFSGNAGDMIWANDTSDGTNGETLAIHTNLSGTSENCTDIFLDFSTWIDADLDEETLNITVANTTGDFAGNVYQVPSGGNVTINSSVWDAQSWCQGTNPFPIDNSNVTFYVRIRQTIPSGKETGTYEVTAVSATCSVVWKVIS